MKVSIETLWDKNQTCKRIVDIGRKYAGDLDMMYIGNKRLSQLQPIEFFRVVKDIPYSMDVYGTEIVARPIHTVRAGTADCKKKTGLCIAYAIKNRIPYRLCCTSRKPSKRIHHIFPQLLMGDRWINYDATYSHYSMGMPKKVTAIEYYYPGGNLA